MVKVALFVRLEAKAGKEAEVESFLKSGQALVEQEPATTAWLAGARQAYSGTSSVVVILRREDANPRTHFCDALVLYFSP